eukprot:1144285-Pelagomonas_calceolata.AAC.2
MFQVEPAGRGRRDGQASCYPGASCLCNREGMALHVVVVSKGHHLVTLFSHSIFYLEITSRFRKGRSDRALCESDYDLCLQEGKHIMAEVKAYNYKVLDGCIFLPRLTIVISKHCCKLFQGDPPMANATHTASERAR